MENFIHVFNVHTQIDLLQSIKTNAGGITLWQALSEEQVTRKLMKIRGLKLNIYDNLLEITPKKKDHSFDSKLPVYFYAQHRTSIFKTKIVFNSNFKVILKWPDNFLIGDERDMPRSYSRKNKIITFNLRVNNHIDKEFQKPIIDDSALGISIRVPYNEIQCFDEGASVKINYKSDIKQGRINYITPLLDKMYPNHLRVGIVYH